MRSGVLLVTAAVFCCLSCVETNYELGGNFISESSKFDICPGVQIPLDVENEKVDSLSGFSQSRFVIGSIRDDVFGLTTRSSVLTLVPMYDSLDFGTDPEIVNFHFTAPLDSISVADESGTHILQSIDVYELSAPVNGVRTYDCNTALEFNENPSEDDIRKGDRIFLRSKRISKTVPVINGSDSLSFDFTGEFASGFLGIKDEDLKDIDTFTSKFPGICFVPRVSAGNGGRINMFSLQLGFNSDQFYLTGSFARMDLRTTYEGEKKDTSFYFYFCPTKMYDVDSLLVNSATGSFPQYCLNLTGHDGAAEQPHSGGGQEKLYVEGGSGLKPHVSAVKLREAVRKAIMDNGHDPDKAVIAKASLIFPFHSEDSGYRDLETYPGMLSPTVRLHGSVKIGDEERKRVDYAGIADASAADENQGEINRSLMCYSPDITYHLQSIVSIKEDDAAAFGSLQRGEYDIWLFTMSYETVITVNAVNDEMSDYYSMLAYQSYYNSMYGGGYGGYGYGGYGDYYSNYYSYMLAAQYANQSTTSSSSSLMVDRDRYYKAVLHGPAYPGGDENPELRPRLVFSYAVPR